MGVFDRVSCVEVIHDLWLGSLSRLPCGRDFPLHTSRASVCAILEAPDAEALTQTVREDSAVERSNVRKLVLKKPPAS